MTGYYYIAAVIVFIFIGSLLRDLRPRIKGWIGEKAMSRELAHLLERDYRILHDVMLPTENGTAQIDHVVISRFGLFVIETKNYRGIIYGQERDTTWTQCLDHHRTYRFMNPLHQNYGHVKVLERLLSVDHIHSIVAFKGGRFGRKMPDNVMRVTEVRNYIQRFRKHVISPVKMQTIVSCIQDSTLRDRASRRHHVKRIRAKRQQVSVKDRPRRQAASVN